jgi:guanyl-specific ribonuclease Sa
MTMPSTIGFGKLEREMLSNDRLPVVVRIAIVEFKNRIRSGAGLVTFKNNEGALPALAAGQHYYEYQVGWATAPTSGDPNARGSHRLVALVDAQRNILKMYLTQEHYAAGSWKQLQYP